MRLVSFTVPHDPAPRTGVLAHDGARVVDLTEIGVASFAEAAERAPQLGRLAAHLLHVPGAVAYHPGSVRLLAPATRVAAVYDAATGVPAVVLAGDARSVAGGAPFGPDAAVPLAPGVELGAGIVAVIGRTTHAVDAGDAERCTAGLAVLACWRSAPGRIEAAAVGPWMATLDEFADSRTAALAIAIDAAVAVNGRMLRGGSWASLTAKLAAAVADASRRAPLEPGDAVAVATFELARAGSDDEWTAASGGHLPQPPGTVPGDEIVLEATNLGVLRAFVGPGRREAVATPAH